MTHHARRLKRRKAARVAQPTVLDMKRWATLVEASARAAGEPLILTGKLAKARNAVRNRVMPEGQAVVGSAFHQLCKLSDRWGSMLALERQDHARELAGLAMRCAAILKALDRSQGGAEPQTPARHRADIDG